MPSRFTQYGGALGADQALQQMVAERLAAQAEAQKQQQQQIENAMKLRALSQGDARIDLDQNEFGYRKTRDAAADTATATKQDQEQLYLGTLPPLARKAAEGRRFGINLGVHDVEDPTAHTAHVQAEEAAKRETDFSDWKRQQDYDEQQFRSRPQTANDSEVLVPILGPDGKSILVPRRDAVGKTPASAREQGRQVISGDANRIADFDTSLNDLTVLSKQVEGEGSTGVMPQIGAAMPNAITNLTGFGVGAKQRQATIDRVKQVIGKALEGGVLRKEDEYKYTKILPTISDHPDVVQSKLRELQSTLGLRRQTLIDSLQDAGYDTSRYNQRQRMVPMVAPDGRSLMVPAEKVAEMEARGAKRR